MSHVLVGSGPEGRQATRSRWQVFGKGWRSSAISAEGGGFLSYGPTLLDPMRRLAFLVDRPLKGAKPADLPVAQASRLELVANVKTARLLGLTIPPSILARADE